MEFVDRHRVVCPVALPVPRLAPVAVSPFIGVAVVHDRCIPRRLLAVEPEGIGLDGQEVAGRALGFELVQGPWLEPRDKQAPDALEAALHGMPATIPGIEIADDAHGSR